MNEETTIEYTQCKCGRMVQVVDGEKITCILEGAVHHSGDGLMLTDLKACPTCGSLPNKPLDKGNWFYKFVDSTNDL